MQFRHVGWGLALVAVMAIFVCLHLLAEVSRLDSARIKLGKWNLTKNTQDCKSPKRPLPTGTPLPMRHCVQTRCSVFQIITTILTWIQSQTVLPLTHDLLLICFCTLQNEHCL